MKITLSKSQWELIGQKTGWIKSAQFPAAITDESVKKLLQIFNALPGILNKTDRVTTYSKEIHDEALGDSYIQIYFNSDKNAIGIDKYYENEFLQNEMGESKLVAVDWDNIRSTIENAKSVINELLGKTNVVEARKKDKVDKVDVYKSIRKPMPKPTKIIEDEKRRDKKDRKFDWRKEINED